MNLLSESIPQAAQFVKRSFARGKRLSFRYQNSLILGECNRFHCSVEATISECGSILSDKWGLGIGCWGSGASIKSVAVMVYSINNGQHALTP